MKIRTIINEIIGLLEVENFMGTEWLSFKKKGTEEKEVITADKNDNVKRATNENEKSTRLNRALAKISNPFTTIDESEIELRKKALKSLEEIVTKCRKCPLCENKTNTVFHDGHPAARLCFVGEGPGAEEDATGIPFVGRAGKLLNKIIDAMGLKRENVYICNTVKCRPPGNRTPVKHEIEMCRPYLEKQIQIVKPQIIVALGLPAAQCLLKTVSSISSNRGKWMDYNGIPVMLTYHPAYLLRNPSAKKDVWEDIKKVHEFLQTGKIPEKIVPQSGSKNASGVSNLSLFDRQ